MYLIGSKVGTRTNVTQPAGEKRNRTVIPSTKQESSKGMGWDATNEFANSLALPVLESLRTKSWEKTKDSGMHNVSTLTFLESRR